MASIIFLKQVACLFIDACAHDIRWDVTKSVGFSGPRTSRSSCRSPWYRPCPGLSVFWISSLSTFKSHRSASFFRWIFVNRFSFSGRIFHLSPQSDPAFSDEYSCPVLLCLAGVSRFLLVSPLHYSRPDFVWVRWCGHKAGKESTIVSVSSWSMLPEMSEFHWFRFGPSWATVRHEATWRQNGPKTMAVLKKLANGCKETKKKK
jgi:hypothetical protein